jgi:hypothetical protein
MLEIAISILFYKLVQHVFHMLVYFVVIFMVLGGGWSYKDIAKEEN